VAQAGGKRGLSAPGRPSGPEAASTVRCFVAVQPDEAARGRLDRLAGEQHACFPSARRMRRENLHLTLAFIGALPRELALQVAARLAAEPSDEFDWALDATGAFGGARVLWVGGSSEALQALAERSRRLLDELGVRYDRKPFVAHVTLLRQVPRESARLATGPVEPPIVWHVSAPVLLQSTTDGDGIRYTPLAAGNT
jgi:RNA 2',3'-cyclic 3'-phosphodiesterase